MKQNQLKLSLLSVVLSCMLLIGCSEANQAGFQAWGTKHRVTLYSGGKQVGQWITVGKVENESQSDGYYFKDAATRKLISISGTVVIEVLD